MLKTRFKTALIISIFLITAFSMLMCGCERKHGEFYTLQEAYENGILTQEDLISIAYYYHSNISPETVNGDLMGEGYQPIEKEPKVLSEKTERSIKKTMISDLKNQNFSQPLKLKNIVISGYYGTYKDYIAVNLAYSSDGVNTALDLALNEYEVGGVKFSNRAYTVFFRNENFVFSNQITVWEN